MIEMEESIGNVFRDLWMINADEMMIKTPLATKIGDIIESQQWSQKQAASILGLPQSKVSRMLRGQLRDISESKLLDCLVRLGHDVKIVVAAEGYSGTIGRISVEFR